MLPIDALLNQYVSLLSYCSTVLSISDYYIIQHISMKVNRFLQKKCDLLKIYNISAELNVIWLYLYIYFGETTTGSISEIAAECLHIVWYFCQIH